MFFQPVKKNHQFSEFKKEYQTLLNIQVEQHQFNSNMVTLFDEARQSMSQHDVEITGETEGIDENHLHFIAQVDPLNQLIGYWQDKFGLEKPQAKNEAKRNIIKRERSDYEFSFENSFTFKKADITEDTVYVYGFKYCRRFNVNSFFQPSIVITNTHTGGSLPYFDYLGENDVMNLNIEPIFDKINALVEQYHAQKSVFFSNSALIKSTRAQIIAHIHLILGPLLARGTSDQAIADLKSTFNSELDSIFNVAPCVLHCR